MSDEKDDTPESPDVHFEPLVNLSPVEVKTHEEEEEELLKLRAKLFRYDSALEPPEWKERGTGDVKILRHKELGTCRVLMRRDKTLKVCANHHVLPHMELKTNCGSDRAWVWSTPSDLTDDEPKAELLAIRFINAENAQKFKEKFDLAKTIMAENLKTDESKAAGKEEEEDENKTDDEKKEADKVADKLGEMSVKEKEGEKKKTEETRKAEGSDSSENQAER